jgi:phasin
MTKRGDDVRAGSRDRRRFRDFSAGPIEDLGPVDAKRDEPATETADRFQISPEMRTIAETSVEQARQAFDTFIGVAQRAVDMLGGQGESAGKGAKGIAEHAMSFAQKDFAISFEFSRRLVRARDVQEVLQLQADYIKARVRLFSEQVKIDPVSVEK